MKQDESLHDFVFGLDADGFGELLGEIEKRRCSDTLGASDFDALAERFGKKPKCPFCGSRDVCCDGLDKNGRKRFRCGCGHRFGLLSGTVLSSAKTSLPQWLSMVKLMSFNVPLDLIAEQIGVHHNTALLMRRKLFETVGEWQGKVRLRGTIYIDEIYTFDSMMPNDHFGPNTRGISKGKCCVFLAVDQYKNMVAFFVGKGMPTSKEIEKALLPHIGGGAASRIIHDGLHSHSKAVAASGASDEIHKSTDKSEGSLKAMLLINSFCAWMRRYLSRFTGMDTEYLQDYLNWFVYLFRCKLQSERWPRDERIIRHILLADVTLRRIDVKDKRAESRRRINPKNAKSSGPNRALREK